MSRRRSTTREAFRGEADEDAITSIGSIERGTSRFDRNWRAGGRRGPEGDPDLRVVSTGEISSVLLLTGFDSCFVFPLPFFFLLFSLSSPLPPSLFGDGCFLDISIR